MRRNIILLNLAQAVIWMSMYVYTPTLPAYAAQFGASATMIGAIGSAYGVMQAALRIPLGMALDKKRKNKLLLIIGYVVLVCSSILFLLADSVEMMIFARGVAGISAAWSVVICTVYAKYNSEKRQVKAQGILNAAASGGKAVGGLLCGIIAFLAGYYATFIASFVIAAFALAIVCSLEERKRKVYRRVRKDPPSFKNVLKNKDVILFSVLIAITNMLCFAIPTLFVSVAAQSIGATDMQLGLLTVVYCAAMAISSLFVGTRAYNKIGGINVLAISFLVGALSALPLFYFMNVPLIFVMQVISGISYGISNSALNGFVIKCVSKRERGMAQGVGQSLSGLGIFIGPLIVGPLVDHVSFDAAFLSMAAAMGIGALLTWLLVPKKYADMR